MNEGMKSCVRSENALLKKKEEAKQVFYKGKCLIPYFMIHVLENLIFCLFIILYLSKRL